MQQNIKFKMKAGYVYVVTNECLKPVKAKGMMVKALRWCLLTVISVMQVIGFAAERNCNLLRRSV